MKNLNMQEAIPLTPPVVDIGHPEDGLFKTAEPDVPILIRNDGFPLGYISSPEDADPVAIYRELNQLSAVPPALITPKRRHLRSLAGAPYPATVR